MDYGISSREELKDKFSEILGESFECNELKKVILQYSKGYANSSKEILEIIQNDNLFYENDSSSKMDEILTKSLIRNNYVKTNCDIIKAMVILNVLQYEGIKSMHTLMDRVYYHIDTYIDGITMEKYVFKYLDSIEYSKKIIILNFLACQKLLPIFCIGEKIEQSRLNKKNFCKLYKVSSNRYEEAKKLSNLQYYVKLRARMLELENKERARPKLVKEIL